jgi:cysteine protease ATG4
MSDSEIARYGKKIVNYFWDPLPRNTEYGSPIHCLGIQYENPPPPPPTDPSLASDTHSQDPDTSPPESEVSRSVDATSELEEISKSQVDEEQRQQADQDDGRWPTPFLDDFDSRIWMTYRSNFPPIPRSQDPKAITAVSLAVRFRNLGNVEGFTADTGWGCMIRSGQSLLANTLSLVEFGRGELNHTLMSLLTWIGWRRGERSLDERKLLSLFADDPKAPFSIHSFVQHGAKACGKHPGEWFGPSATARCIQYVEALFGVLI